MNARVKLNQAFVYGALIAAAVIGGATRSWLVFFIILGISVLANLHSGNIRVRPRR